MTLSEFFETNNKIALAFSGGVDSAYLMYAAKKYGADVKAYYVHSQFQPEFELEDAKRLAAELDVSMEIIELDVLTDDNVRANVKKRCYFCKKVIFSNICKHALRDGYNIIIDGTNASDDADDRPGMKALVELSVKSPLREGGLTKSEIRSLSKEAGLFTWDKPAYACLATRVLCEEEITPDKLYKIEIAEQFLMQLGFFDIRVRVSGDTAKIQIHKEQFELFNNNLETIMVRFNELFSEVLFDLNGRP